jgi:hypothetical protein
MSSRKRERERRRLERQKRQNGYCQPNTAAGRAKFTVVTAVPITQVQRRKSLIGNRLQYVHRALRFMPIIQLQRRNHLRARNIWHCDKM